MKKKLLALALISVFLLVMSGCDQTQSAQEPVLEKPVFVKMLVYADDMDAELYYISNTDWDKAISKIEIVDAPKGIECTLYDEAAEHVGKYDIVTVQIGVSSDHLDKNGGIAEDLEINKVNITWDDGSKSTEDIGRLTMTAEDLDFLTVVGNGGGNDAERVECNFTIGEAEQRTEITGIRYPFKELEELIDNVQINDTSLSEISVDHPLILKKGEACNISMTMERHIQYGKIWVAAKLMKKEVNKEVKYTNLAVNMLSNVRFSNSKDITDYLKTAL